MTEFTFWLVLAGILVVSEILTGTFYLLIVAVGALLAALIAHLGYSLEMQIGAGSVFAIIACLVLQSFKKKLPPAASTSSDKLDIGNLLEITQWDSNGMSKVLYRGANWQVQCNDAEPSTGMHSIVDVRSNTLLVTHKNNL